MPSRAHSLLERGNRARSSAAAAAAAEDSGRAPFLPLLRPVMPELDAIRGVAVLLVVFYHGFFWSNNDPAGHSAAVRAMLLATRAGWLGVELFFVLSGFLITNILLGSRERPNYYSRFYSRRAFRILPAYLVLLAALLATRMADWPFVTVSALFLANVSPYLGVPMQFGPLWSLAVEEHFYLLWPAAVRSLSRQRLLILALAIVVAEPLVRAMAFRVDPTVDLNGPTWFMLDGLAFGALLALVIRISAERRDVLRRLCIILAIGGALMLLAGTSYGLMTRRRVLGAGFQVTPWYMLFTATVGGMLLLGSGPRRQWARVPALVFFGTISYGLYLVHMLIFALYDRRVPAPGGLRTDSALLVRFVVCVAIAVAIAALSRWTLEAYFLALKDRSGRARRAEREAVASVEADR